jgi:hypothetical protein
MTEMSDIWKKIDELNPFDKMVVYELYLQGYCAEEAYQIWESNKELQSLRCFPVKIRKGEEPIPDWVFKRVKELENRIEERHKKVQYEA